MEYLFSIPDFYNKFKLQEILLDIMDKEPGLFNPNIKIDSVYGSFPGAIWNGGRGCIGGTTYTNIRETIKFFNDRGISVRFTFTNSQVEERHLGDYYCNTILEIASEVSQETKTPNGVNVNRDCLRNYVGMNYPDLYLIYSTTKSIDDMELFNRMSENTLTVANYNWNEDIIKKYVFGVTDTKIDIQHPENVELLVSEACIENCPNRMAHYADIGKQQILQPSNGYSCPFGAEIYYYYDTPVRRKHFISPENMIILTNHGINKFKISGRNDNNVNLIENYVNYFSNKDNETARDNLRNKLLISLLGF